MVKFSKELEAQLIPEWKDAFVNYWQLKKQVKKIKLARVHNKQPPNAARDFGVSVFDPVRLVTKKISDKLFNFDKKTEIIQVNSKIMEDGEEEEIFETELAQLFSAEDEVRVFFEGLDEELNKVNQFYKTKETEFIERGEILNKQLQILLDLKQILNDRRWKNSGSRHNVPSVPSSWSSSPRNSDCSSECLEESNTTPTEITQRGEAIAALEKNGVNFIHGATRGKTKKGKPKVAMRIDIPNTTPTRTITAVTSMLWEDLVNNPKKEGPGEFINRKKIQCAEKMIRGAFVELYRGLGLLRTYSSLNMVAFTKILKKFDKVSNQQASASYLKAVKRSHFISSDKVIKLMDEVESIFTKNFASDDKKKAMKFLRPQQNKDSHMLTFFVGLFTGCFVSLFSVYAILAHLSGIFSPTTERDYLETVYPVFSVFALLSLHLFMYGCNLFMWKNTRINYNFIFEFQPSTALKYRDAFLICTTFMTAVVGAMVVHLILRANGFSSQVDAIPGIFLLFSIALLICPFDIFYRPTRYCFIRVIRNIVCSPLYKVLMVDFFMADQLTSQIPLLRHMESTACYFLAGSFRTHQYETCRTGRLFRELLYVISFLPYYWRAMQILNAVLRVAWVETVMGFQRIPDVESRLLDFLLASLEVIRRGHWNFYRLENEHLNNVGKYRAVKAVPLPFRETDSDG
ncbi:hypothetical protein GBA52_005234 [Prunus armeniaca]|nr:hypothetical protein GBA52_005234 [Prunus armeniaca]